jgi:NRAMP (natural resistance-associated macrophage protein)-like metal ion transporter
MGRLWRRAVLIVGVLGPGFVTASAGNDVGGITTYSAAGAKFGYTTLWTLTALTISLIVVQEMAARMGAVTGKGLSGLIRENFGVRLTFLAMTMLFFVNTGIAATEFAGIATASEMFHVSRYLAIPLAMVVVFVLVLRFPNRIVERIFVGFSLVYLGYAVSAVLAHPDWHAVVRDSFVPTILPDRDFLVTCVGIVGTTISPYMQFFLQSEVIEKRVSPRELWSIRADVIVGSMLAIVLAGFMIVANAATIYTASQHGAHPPINLDTAQATDFASALRPLAGEFAAALYAVGILNAGLFTAAVLPLATAFIVCEAFGFEASLDRKFRGAPIFYTLFASGIVLGALLVLLVPFGALFKLIFYAQVVQGVLLPLEFVMMLIIINRKRVMGSFANSRLFNVLAWATTIVIGTLALYYVYQSLTGS